MKIEIKSATAGEQLIEPSNKPDAKVFTKFTKVTQTAFVHGMIDRHGSPEPYAVKISLDLGTKEKGFRPPYPPGAYEIDDASFFVDRFDGLCLGRIALKSVQPALTRAAA